MKLLSILRFILPLMMWAASYLGTLDANTTGTDDKIATILKVAIAAIQQAVSSDPALVGQAKTLGLV